MICYRRSVELFGRHDWGKVVGVNEPTYRSLAFDFVPTMIVQNDQRGPIRFRLRGTWYQKPDKWFSSPFGCILANGVVTGLSKDKVKRLWRSIASQIHEFAVGRVSVSKIDDPAMRALPASENNLLSHGEPRKGESSRLISIVEHGPKPESQHWLRLEGVDDFETR